jgi:hypothetical protein
METGGPVIGSKLKYAIVELTTKNSSNIIECGLFMGMQVKTPNGEDIDLSDLRKKVGSVYLWLYMDDDKKARAYNMDFFNILSLETYNGISRVVIYFMATDSDQKEALKIAKQAMAGLSEMATGDPDIINIKKFTDLPPNFKSSRQTVTGANSSISTGQSRRFTPATRKTTTGPDFSTNYTRTTYVKRDPEPTTFERKGRRPTKKALEKLTAKLDQIAKGEYEGKLPRIKGDTKKEREKTVGVEIDDDEFNNCHWY